MKCMTLAAAGAVAISTGLMSAHAATTNISQSECTKLWQEANPSGADGLTKAQSAPYILDFKAANPDGDATIDVNEWNAACKKGLVTSASSSGASSGTTGEDVVPNPKEHAPTNRLDKMVPPMVPPGKEAQ